MNKNAITACALLGVLTALPARAQGVSLEGAWSWSSPGQDGMDQNTLLFQPNGTYVRVSRLANGELLKYWGGYTAVQVSRTQIRLQSHTQGWLPVTFCAQAPGFAPQCSPEPRPPEMSFVVQFTSPSTIIAEGTTMSRDPAPYLLQQQVPQQVMLAARAPVQPNIQQPVMPTLHLYETPNGPGNQMANGFHAANRDRLDQVQRGCYIDQYGRRWGCEQ